VNGRRDGIVETWVGTHSQYFQLFQKKPWFKKLNAERHIITIINRMISNHTCLRSHLRRISILEIQICVCGVDYETVDHVLWRCRRFQAQRHHLVDELQQLGVPSGVPVRDLMGSHNWKGLQACSSFFKKCGVTV
jgi:hypothetical protein